jgi:hypothetical protein
MKLTCLLILFVSVGCVIYLGAQKKTQSTDRTVERTRIWDEEPARVREQYADAIKKWREDADKARAAGLEPFSIAKRSGRSARISDSTVNL